jgi:hypothetical protein
MDGWMNEYLRYAGPGEGVVWTQRLDLFGHAIVLVGVNLLLDASQHLVDR